MSVWYINIRAVFLTCTNIRYVPLPANDAYWSSGSVCWTLFDHCSPDLTVQLPIGLSNARSRHMWCQRCCESVMTRQPCTAWAGVYIRGESRYLPAGDPSAYSLLCFIAVMRTELARSSSMQSVYRRQRFPRLTCLQRSVGSGNDRTQLPCSITETQGRHVHILCEWCAYHILVYARRRPQYSTWLPGFVLCFSFCLICSVTFFNSTRVNS